MPGTAPRSVNRSASRLTRLVMVVAASVIALSGIIVVPTITAPPAAAAVIGDDYPAYLKNAVQDSLTDPWKFFNRECTSFVAWRLNSVNGVPFGNFYAGPQAFGNANTWGTTAKNKGFIVDQIPAIGAVAWSNTGSYGHVAWVSNVLDDGRIVIEEYNAGVRGAYRTRIVAASSFAGFIHIKDLPSWPATEGSFVRVNETGEIHRIVGGAPLYVESWTPYGRAQHYQNISASQFASLPAAPRDGTVIRSLTTGSIYTVAMGAPIHVASWAGVGGEKRYMNVAGAVISKAGGTSPWNRLRDTPTDGFLRGAVSGAVYRVADGHPYYVSSFAPYGGVQPFVNVDEASIDRCDHLKCEPWGFFDSATGGSASVNLVGWVQDPNSQAPVNIEVYVDKVLTTTVAASATRKDVDDVYHHGTQHGFNTVVPTTPGEHTVCVTGVNTGAGDGNTELGCRTVTALPATLTSQPVPSISGSATIGQTLTANAAIWEPAPVTLRYQWLRDGAAIVGATASTLAVTAADQGAALTVAVTGSKDGYASAVKSSAATVRVPVPVIVPVGTGSWPPAERSFVRNDESGEIFRIAGGAALYVDSWAPYGGPQLYQGVSAAKVASLPSAPADGTLVRAAGSGAVYTIAKGAPIHVSSFANIGGERPWVNVGDTVIANAGSASPWHRLRATPADGFIRGAVSGAVFRVVDARPYYVTSFAPYGGVQPYVNVDEASIKACDRLVCEPAGAFESAVSSGGTVTVSGWAQDPNVSSPIAVQVTIDGVLVGSPTANGTRADVEARFHNGTEHGFAASFAATPGPRTVCVTAVNSGAGKSNTLLGCKTIKAS